MENIGTKLSSSSEFDKIIERFDELLKRVELSSSEIKNKLFALGEYQHQSEKSELPAKESSVLRDSDKLTVITDIHYQLDWLSNIVDRLERCKTELNEYV
jgi:hypothetical protein